MKRILSCLIIFVLILSPAGCGSNRLLELDSDISSSDRNIELVTEKDVYNSDVKVIKYTITNKDFKETCISTPIELHKKIDGEWKQLAFKTDAAFNSIAMILEYNKPYSKEMKLDEYYKLPLEKGEYRIFKPEDNIYSNTFNIE